MGFIKNNWCLFTVLFIVYTLGVFFVLYLPSWEGPAVLQKNYMTFGISFMALVLIFAISFFLFHRWEKTRRENKSTLIWAVSFLLFSITFIGMILQSVGVSWVNFKVPWVFFLFRQSMIFFVIGLYLGIVRLMTDSSFFNKSFPLIIFIVAYSWFIYSLLVLENIELCMYGFIYFLFAPMCFLVGCLFRNYANQQGIFGVKLIGFGFGAIGLTYLGWAPWHNSYFYFLLFCLFVLALVLVLVGFIYLSLNKLVEKEQKSKEKVKKEVRKLLK